MNRGYTVWLDQLRDANATSLPSSAASVPLPTVFSLESLHLPPPPATKREGFLRLIHFLWANRWRFLTVFAIYKFLRKLHELSKSHQESKLPLPIPNGLYPSFIPSASTGVWLYTRSYRVVPELERGRIFLIHAYREHIGRYEPFIQQLNTAGYSVFAMDHQGHGRSGGVRGYVESFQHYIQDYIEFMSLTLAREVDPANKSSASLPCFLFGHSMGATIALQIARIQEWRRAAEEEDEDQAATAASSGSHSSKSKPIDAIAEDKEWEESSHSLASFISHSPSASPSSTTPRWQVNGLILSCPALIPETMAVTPLVQMLASTLADILPRFGFSTVQDLSLLSNEPQAIERFNADPLTYRGNMNSRFGHEMLAAMSDTRAGLSEITLPTLCCQGRYDCIISPTGAHFLKEHIGARDMELRLYEGSHDLYLDSTRAAFTKDVLNWLQRQTNWNLKVESSHGTTGTEAPLEIIVSSPNTTAQEAKANTKASTKQTKAGGKKK